MTNEEFKNITGGDIVRHITKDEVWLVTANYGGRAIAVNTRDITNPSEWELVAKVSYELQQKDKYDGYLAGL